MDEADRRKRRAERRARWQAPQVAKGPAAVATEIPAELAGIEKLRQLPPPIGPGIYFLYKGSSLVYIGQGIRAAARAYTHWPERDFDRVFVLECQTESLDWFESYYIHKLKPPENHCHSSGEIAAPLSAMEVEFVTGERFHRVPSPHL